MRFIVEAGTDAAALLLFDPQALPEEFDARIRGDPGDLLQHIHETGRVCWMNTGADGAYLLHAHVNEPVAAALQQYIREPIILESFPAPSGRVYFTGVEYAFRSDDRFLRKHPHMGGAFEVTPGVYRLTVWRTEYPDGLVEGLFRKQVSPRLYWHHEAMGWLVLAAVLGFVALSGAALLTPRDFWLPYLLPVWIMLLLLPIVWSRLGSYRQAREQYQQIEREFPSIVAHLEWKAENTDNQVR